MINPTEHFVTVPDQDLISIKSEEFVESKINALKKKPRQMEVDSLN